MTTDRMNFNEAQRLAAFECNAMWLKDHDVDGVFIALAYEGLRRKGQIYYCENCLFCHTDRNYFNVDHLVPDLRFKQWGKHHLARDARNMAILCYSRQKRDYGCNQSKSANYYVPRRRGLAFSHPEIDMNCYPVSERPFEWAGD